MAKINGLCVGESLVGEGNEVAHIDLIMGPRKRGRDRIREVLDQQQGRFYLAARRGGAELALQACDRAIQ